MLNTSMDRKGMSKEEYQRRQEQCEQEKFIVETNKRLQNIELSLARLQKEIQSFEAERGSLESSCNSQINEIMNSTMSSLKEFRQTIGDYKTYIENQNVKLTAMQHSLDLYVKQEEFKEYEDYSFKIHESIKFTIRKFREEYNGLLERQKIDFSNQLKELKEELLSRPTGVPELQKLLESKIELVELNGQNAVLRSSNNEKQILLVERKIDNIYQLIKKIELSKE